MSFRPFMQKAAAPADIDSRYRNQPENRMRRGVRSTALTAFGIAALTLGGASALAGQKLSYPVAIYPNFAGPGTVFFYGAMGSVRNSTDATEMIGCYIDGYQDLSYPNPSTPVRAVCTARRTDGVTAACTSLNSALIDIIGKSVRQDSLLAITADAGGNCSRITIYNNSVFEPKVR